MDHGSWISIDHDLSKLCQQVRRSIVSMNTAMSASEAADQWQHTLLLLRFTNELDELDFRCMDSLLHEFSSIFVNFVA